jgi:hypothetical protein
MTLHTILVSGELRNIPELPPQPNKEDWENTHHWQIAFDNYLSALESAKNNAIPYEDQVWAKTLIQFHFDDPNFEVKEGEVYSIEYLGRIEVKQFKNDKDAAVASGYSHPPQKLVRLIPESKEESQEELWDKAIELLYDACHKNMMADVDEMKTGDDFVKWRASLMSSHFTITRKTP